MAVRGEFSPFSGPNCKIVNSVGQGKVKEFQNPLAVATMLGLFKRGWETSYIYNTNAKEVSLVCNTKGFHPQIRKLE